MPAEGAANPVPTEAVAWASPTPAAPAASVRVRDTFVRAFHWLLVAGFLLAARLLRGSPGPRHARVADFVRHPSAILSQLTAVVAKRDGRHLGHNPAGGAMILALPGVVLLVGVTGWLSRTEWLFGIKWMEGLHAALLNAAFGLVCLHLIGVLHNCWRYRENLFLSVLTGRKRGI